MRHIALGLIFGLFACTLNAETPGLRLTKIEMPHHDRRAGLTIWYPAGSGGDRTRFAENGVFEGVDVAIWADVAAGQHPVVLYSHGMGGTVRAQAWLAAGLAARGAIVVSVNHPNSTWGDFDMADGVKHWTRAQDLSAALDMLLADPDFAPHADSSRIMAAGFSYGGWTALSLAGLTGNHAGAVAACRDHIDMMPACTELLSSNVALQDIDPDLWNASYADARVTHVAAMDPGFVWGLGPANTKHLVPEPLMIGFGGPADRMPATDFEASGLASLLPTAQILQFDPAFHFTAMPLCKPQGAAILEAENDDPVCTDPPGSQRADVHKAIIDALAAKLGL